MSDLSFSPAQVERWVHSRIPEAKKQGREFRAKCPVHHGERLSFAINTETGQAFCHSSCGRGWDLVGLEQELTGADFKGALESVEALVGSIDGTRRNALGEVVAAYDYVNEQGELLYQVTRHAPKDFRQRRPDGAGGWVWGLNGARRVLYRLPELIQAPKPFIVEGEKDVETLRAMGFCATCNSGGAGKWLPAFAQYFVGKHATIIPDSDEPGRKHALQVAENLLGTAASVRVLELPRGKDVSDWTAAGGDAEQLAALADNAPTLTPAGLETLRQRWFAAIGPADPAMPAAGAPKIQRVEDLPSVFTFSTAEVEWAVTGMIATGTVNLLTSESGSGKTTLAHAIAHAIRRGANFAGMATVKRPVLIFDRENPAAYVADILTRMHATDGDGLWVWGGWVPEQADPVCPMVQGWILSCDPRPFIVVDSLVSCHPGDENDATQTRNYMQGYRRLADLGASVLLLHHSGKGESSEFYRGSSDIKASSDCCLKLSNIGSGSAIERIRLRPFKSRFLIDSEFILTYSDGLFSREGAGCSQRRTDAELLTDILKEHAGMKTAEFQNMAVGRGVSRSSARTFLENRTRDGSIQVEIGLNNTKRLSWRSDDGDGELF